MGVVQTIKPKRSSSSSAPTGLAQGEIATNLTLKKIYLGTGSANIEFPDTSGIAAMIAAAAYTHPSDGGGSIATALTGANVISKLVVNTAGHVTATETRALTPANIGAAPIGHTMYIGTTGLALNRSSAAVALTGITSIDGSAAKLTTPRALTIGSTAKNFDGSAAVSWSLEDINTHLNTIAGLSTQGLLKRSSTTWVIDTTAYLPAAGGTISGDLTVNGDLVITGETITANVETMTVEDPIITLGGTTAPTVNDNKDRGVEFRWHNGTVAKVGFFGFDRSSQKFTFIPDATNPVTDEVFEGNVGTILANFEGTLTGNASTATKLETARTIWGQSFDGTSDISGAITGATSGAFSSNVTIGGTLGVTGTTTLPGGLFDYAQKTITFSYGVGITSGALTLEGKSTMKTPYVDFFHYDGTGGYSRIIEEATKELSIYGGASADGKIKLKSDTYAEKALYIGGASGAKLVFVAASGDTPAYLKLQNYDGGVMHFVTTGGQTMYSTGVPAGGGGGSATVILNGETNDNPRFWAPEVAGTTTGQYLKWNNTTGIPEWGTLPSVTKAQIEEVLTGEITSHYHTFDSLNGIPNTLAGYGIGDAVHSSHEGAGGGAHAVANAKLNGFMSSDDKKNLDNLYSNLAIFNAGQASGRTLALASGLIPAYFHNKRNVMLMFGDGNEQHVYIWIATTDLIADNKNNTDNWLRISKPDVDGGVY